VGHGFVHESNEGHAEYPELEINKDNILTLGVVETIGIEEALGRNWGTVVVCLLVDRPVERVQTALGQLCCLVMVAIAIDNDANGAILVENLNLSGPILKTEISALEIDG
jgi:hypothetical protein